MGKPTDSATRESEAKSLRDLMVNAKVKNKAQFARELNIGLSRAMLHQHMNGIKPIPIEAGQAYAKALGVPLRQISPRLADQLGQYTKAAQNLCEPAPAPYGVTNMPEKRPRKLIAELIDRAELLDDTGLNRLIGYASALLDSHAISKANPASSSSSQTLAKGAG